jgi:lipopolysaccharide biosynthesis glycosyltransferase
MNGTICFSIDENFVPHLSAAIESLIANNNSPLDVFIVDFGLSQTSKDNFVSQARGCIKSLNFISPPGFIADFQIISHFTSAMYGRLILPGYLENREKIIYSDADVIFMRDLAPILDIELGDFPIAAVSNVDNSALQRLLETETQASYLDSGLLIFNTKVWNKSKLTNLIWHIVETKSDLSLPDNDAINIAIKGHFLELAPHFSYQTHYYKTYPATRALADQAIVLQFAGPVKPNSYSNRDPFRSIYRDFLSHTPYKATIDQDKSFKLIISKLWRAVNAKS